MPPRRSSQKPGQNRKPAPPATPPKPQQTLEEVVDPRWLLKALGITVVAAMVCAWLALCLLYYQGSWQLVLRPSRTVDRTPANLNIPFEEVHFDASETGQPRLTGWWIPYTGSSSSAPGAPRDRSADTILYLHDGIGSLSQTVPVLALLHSCGINIFALDYRGFGHSGTGQHPNSQTMSADAAAALSYLTATRHLPPDHIVPYGAGLGASLAVALARNHGELAAVIVDNPDPDPTRTAIGAHPSGVVPIRLLYHEHFEIAGPLSTLPTPKLLIAGGPNARLSAADDTRLETLYRNAASPAMSVLLPASGFNTAYVTSLTRFLDQYLPPPSPAR